MTNTNTKKIKRQFTGAVVSDRMAKTVVVRVDRVRIHPKYHKRYTESHKYKVHDEKGIAHVGHSVVFEECRPISKDKRWRLVEIVK